MAEKRLNCVYVGVQVIRVHEKSVFTLLKRLRLYN